jgi:hypothetical protein
MAIIPDLSQVIRESELTFEEVRAFETGLAMLSEEEQVAFMNAIKKDPELIYPLYINFKAKLRAASGDEKDWKEAIETEIVQLEDFMTKRKVGNEIKN